MGRERETKDPRGPDFEHARAALLSNVVKQCSKCKQERIRYVQKAIALAQTKSIGSDAIELFDAVLQLIIESECERCGFLNCACLFSLRG